MQHYLNPFITNLFPVRQYSSWLLYSAYEQKKPPTQSLPMAWHSWHVPGNFSLSTAYRHTQVYKCLDTKKPIISPTYLTGLPFSLIVGEIHSYHFKYFHYNHSYDHNNNSTDLNRIREKKVKMKKKKSCKFKEWEIRHGHLGLLIDPWWLSTCRVCNKTN